jgi:hypothetical protein
MSLDQDQISRLPARELPDAHPFIRRTSYSPFQISAYRSMTWADTAKVSWFPPPSGYEMKLQATQALDQVSILKDHLIKRS